MCIFDKNLMYQHVPGQDSSPQLQSEASLENYSGTVDEVGQSTHFKTMTSLGMKRGEQSGSPIFPGGKISCDTCTGLREIDVRGERSSVPAWIIVREVDRQSLHLHTFNVFYTCLPHFYSSILDSIHSAHSTQF